MRPSSQFEITRRLPGINASAKYGTAGVTSAVRGLALGAHATDPEQFDVAGHNNFIGFLTRRVTPTGLSLADRVFGVTSDTPVGVEAPFKAGEEVTVEKALEIEVEGWSYLFSGTGQLAANTSIPQALSLNSGKWRIAQAGEVVRGTLSATGLTTTGQDTDPTVFRCRIEMVL